MTCMQHLCYICVDMCVGEVYLRHVHECMFESCFGKCSTWCVCKGCGVCGVYDMRCGSLWGLTRVACLWCGVHNVLVVYALQYACVCKVFIHEIRVYVWCIVYICEVCQCKVCDVCMVCCELHYVMFVACICVRFISGAIQAWYRCVCVLWAKCVCVYTRHACVRTVWGL